LLFRPHRADDTIRQQSKWVRYIQAETERMSKLTGDLLYLTQMEDAREAAIFVPFSASDAAESVILTMEAVIFERKIALEYEIEPGLSVVGSSEQFKQVVMILLDNAIKYANPEGAIRIRLKRHHHDMLLTVANTGEGIASIHLDRIFDRFYRTDPSRTRANGGYGLGLAIAKAIVEKHKGRVYAKSTLGGWTAFSVQLPLTG
jgi:two-component system, OmpR family, sensor histidine kinase CiaH